MNVLILNWRDPMNPRSGGAEYVTHQHAKAWVDHGDRVTWFASGFAGAKNEEVLNGVRIVRAGNTVSVFFRAVTFYFKHRHDIDVIVDEAHGIPFFSALYARKPVILFIHEVAGRIWRVMYAPPIRWLGQLLERLYLLVYRSRRIWTDAPSTVDELVRLGMLRQHIIAIPCPIAKRSLPKQPIKDAAPTFIFVGRLVRMKRIEDIIRAFCTIRKALPHAKLEVVGEGNPRYISELSAFARSLGITDHITWHGKVTEKRKFELLRASHLLLHASVKEGWGLVVLEAASQWTPSVVYGVPGLVDTVRDGKTGIIVKNENPMNLASRAVSLFRDTKRYAEMQKQGAKFSDSFRWEEVTIQSRRLLQEAYEANE